jgi:hypothetical protein
LTFSVGSQSEVLPLPPIGLGTASHELPLSEVELSRLAALNLGHLRVDLQLSDPGFHGALKQAWNEAKSLGVPLEASLLVPPAGDSELHDLRNLLDELRPEIKRWLVYPEKELFWGGSPVALVVELAHKYLDGYRPGSGRDVQFCSGTNTDLIFMQRSLPPLERIDAVTFAITAEVHAADESSVMETLEAQPMVVHTAGFRAGGMPVIVSPVTFKMRHNPYATGPWPVLRPGELPPLVQERQMSLFAAAWTAGSLKALSESGARSLTYFETSGWRGVMETAGGSPLPEKFRSLPGSVFPLYHVFADVGEFAAGEVIRTHTSDRLRVDGIALHKSGRTRVVVANMTPEPQRVQVCNLGPQVVSRRLDETSVLEAMQSPEDFRQSPGETLVTRAGVLELELPPYGLARLDSE